MVIVWWIYVLTVVLLFFFVLLGHVLLRRINETRLEDRLHSQRERTAVSAQTSFILDKNTKRTDSKNLKEDKRTSKSLSLVFSKDKSFAHTNLRELISNDSRGKKLHDKTRRSDPSTNIEKEISSFTTAFSTTSSSKDWSKVCMQDIPNSDLCLIKNVSSTKGDVSFGKSDEIIKLQDSNNDMLPTVKDNKSVHSDRVSSTPEGSNEDITSVSLKNDKSIDENVKEFVKTDDFIKDMMPSVQDNRFIHDNNLITHKDIKQLLVVKESADTNNKESIIIHDIAKNMLQSPTDNKTTLGNMELIIPKDSYKNIKTSLNINEDIDKTNGSSKDILSLDDKDSYKDLKPLSVITSNEKSTKIHDTAKDILPLQKYDKTIHNDMECIIPKDSYKYSKPSITIHEYISKSNKEFVKSTDSSKNILSSLKYNKYNKEFIKAKDSVPNMLKIDGNINKNVEDVNKTKDHARVLFSSLSTDEVKDNSIEITGEIVKEPSSLFFGTLSCAPCTPSTPKEMFAPYEIALTSGKSSKTNTTYSTIPAETESKHAADGSSCTTRTKSKCEIKLSKDNVTSSVSRVIFNPETKTSYIKVMEDQIIPKPETEIPTISIQNKKIYELTQTKDNVSKCTSRVTFAKKEIVITDSVSMVDHVCVVTPPTAALASECETVCSNEFDIESTSNSNLEESTTIDSHDQTKENASNPFKHNFINESVTVTNSIYRPYTNETVENVTDKYNYDLEASQTSSDIQSEKRSEKDVVRPVISFNTKLFERLSTVVKDEASTSRSLSTVIKNEASTSFNNIDYPEIIIVDNKFSGDTELSSRKGDKEEKIAAEKKVHELKNEVLEIEDNVDTLSLESLKQKSVQDDTQKSRKNYTRNQNDDGSDNAEN